MARKARKIKAATPVPALRVEAKQWPAHSLAVWPIERLTPYANNARTHSEEQLGQIMQSIARWGWTTPVLVDDAGMILAGHGRVVAGKRLGFLEVPVIIAHGWSAVDKRAYIIADNKIAENAGWDRDLLASELNALAQEADIDLRGLVGFAQAELDNLLTSPPPLTGRTDPNAAPEPDAFVVSQRGDLWLLGEHRLVCGDSTDPVDVLRVLAGERPHLMVTDPPYGVNYDPAWRREAGLNGPGAAVGKVQNDDRADWTAAWALFPGSVAYVWHGGLHAGVVQMSLATAGFQTRAQIIWRKLRPVMSRGAYHWQHEPAFYAVKAGEDDQWQHERFEPEHEVAAYAVAKGEKAQWAGGRRQSTVWEIEHFKSETGHGTQKPVECMRRPMLNNSRAGESVYEPFSGSGTTIIAAHMSGRRAFAVEIDPAYVDVAVKRWEAFTGLPAFLDGTDATFADIAAIRAAEEAERLTAEAAACASQGDAEHVSTVAA